MNKVSVRGKKMIDRITAMGVPFVVERAQFPMEEDDVLYLTGTNYHIQLGTGYCELWETEGDKFIHHEFRTIDGIVNFLAIML